MEVPCERSGHTAVVEGNLLYVWGGVKSAVAKDIRLPSKEIWVYDLEKSIWKHLNTTRDVPPSMSGACGCSFNGHMYIFGGYDYSGECNELYCVNLTDGKYEWIKIIPKMGSAPSPRDKLSCWVHKGRIIYFGGYGEKIMSQEEPSRTDSFIIDEGSWIFDIFWGWNNEVHIFDPFQSSWSEPKTHGRPPSPRAAHASAILECRGYIFGGIVGETRMNDLHCLDLKSWTWSEIIPVSTTPVGRSWHTLTAVSDSSLFLFGGVSVESKPMSDGWMFDIETKKWKEVEHPFKSKPRLWHTACAGLNSDVIVFGGRYDYVLKTSDCNDALIFQMEPYPLCRICMDYITKNIKSSEVLKIQLPFLPPRLLTPVQRRMPQLSP